MAETRELAQAASLFLTPPAIQYHSACITTPTDIQGSLHGDLVLSWKTLVGGLWWLVLLVLLTQSRIMWEGSLSEG